MMSSLALLPSPLLGPAVWERVAVILRRRGRPTLTYAAVPAVLTGQNVLDSFCAALPSDQDLVLIAHSNAGVFVPELVRQRRVVAAVFVDAVLPPAGGQMPLAPPKLLAVLREKADAQGQLPIWTSWWTEEVVAGLFPDPRTRAQVEIEQQQLPVAYFEGVRPVPERWDEIPVAYLAFGDTYATQRDLALQRHWPVHTLAGGHLHMLIDPSGVATELTQLLDQLGQAKGSAE